MRYVAPTPTQPKTSWPTRCWSSGADYRRRPLTMPPRGRSASRAGAWRTPNAPLAGNATWPSGWLDFSHRWPVAAPSVPTTRARGAGHPQIGGSRAAHPLGLGRPATVGDRPRHGPHTRDRLRPVASGQEATGAGAASGSMPWCDPPPSSSHAEARKEGTLMNSLEQQLKSADPIGPRSSVWSEQTAQDFAAASDTKGWAARSQATEHGRGRSANADGRSGLRCRDRCAAVIVDRDHVAAPLEVEEAGHRLPLP
jgi:hypothetical protein